MTNAQQVRVRRVYDPPDAADGVRILVDRLWPRGLRKDSAHLDEWCRQVAPSAELRAWYAHDPRRLDEFTRRYRAELADPERGAALAHLREVAKDNTVTLLTATREVDISHASVLVRLIRH